MEHRLVPRSLTYSLSALWEDLVRGYVPAYAGTNAVYTTGHIVPGHCVPEQLVLGYKIPGTYFPVISIGCLYLEEKWPGRMVRQSWVHYHPISAPPHLSCHSYTVALLPRDITAVQCWVFPGQYLKRVRLLVIL